MVSGGSTGAIHFAPIEHFGEFQFHSPARAVPVNEWRRIWNRRLRPFLLSGAERSIYQDVAQRPDSSRLGLEASVGIGYVSGANEFFHLRPSEAARWSIPEQFLQPTVRNGRALPDRTLSPDTIEEWRLADQPMLLLRIPRDTKPPSPVVAYLDSEKGQRARQTYKCRNRNPWYSVPRCSRSRVLSDLHVRRCPEPGQKLRGGDVHERITCRSSAERK